MSEQDLDLIVARLKSELKRPSATGGESPGSAAHWPWPARAQAERYRAVTADRPLLYRFDTWGRAKGIVLWPVKIVLRKLMRWYVEPALAQQRDFNSSVLAALDELSERVGALAAELERRSSR